MAAMTVNVNIIRDAVEKAFRGVTTRNPMFTTVCTWNLLGDGGEHDGHLLSTVRTKADGDPPEFWLTMPGTRIEYCLTLTTPWRDLRDRPAAPADLSPGPSPEPSGPDGH